MDFNKLTTADKVIGASGIVFLIAMFLPWWGIEIEGFGTGSNSGWDYLLTGILPLLIILALVLQIAIAKFSATELPTPPIPWSQIHLVAGGVVAVLLVLRVVIGSSEGSGTFEIDLDRMYGLWIALLAAIGVGAGGFLKSKEPEDVLSAGPYQGGSGAPPPPPPGGTSF